MAFSVNKRYPLVVKALNSAGNDHVYFCDNDNDLTIAAQTALGSKTIFGDEISEVMVEEYISGDLFLVEFFVKNDKLLITAIWEVKMQDLPQERGKVFWRFSLNNDSKYATEISKAVEEIVIKTGVRIGPGLIELKLCAFDQQFKLIEIGSRLSGIELPIIQKEVSDFDPLGETIRCFVSPHHELPAQVRVNKNAALHFIKVKKAGKVRQINGLDAIHALPSFFKEKIVAKVGGNVQVTRDQSTLAAVFYLVHQSQQQLDQDCQTIDELFELLVD